MGPIATTEQLNVLMPFADANEDTCQQTPCIECCAVSPQRGFRLGSVCYVAVNRVRQFRPRGAFEVVEIQDILKVLRHMVGPLSFAARLPRVRADGNRLRSPSLPRRHNQGQSAPRVMSLAQVHRTVRLCHQCGARGRCDWPRDRSPHHIPSPPIASRTLKQHWRDVASPTSASFDGVPGLTKRPPRPSRQPQTGTGCPAHWVMPVHW